MTMGMGNIGFSGIILTVVLIAIVIALALVSAIRRDKKKK